MRHTIASFSTGIIAALLVGGAALFGWLRSSQLVLTDEGTALKRFEPVPAGRFDWGELGASSYRRNCANCHGADGRGWDQYPGLGHTARLALAPPDGRGYAIDLHLYGLTSPRWRAPMPPMGHLRDVELAAVLNHVLTSYGNGHDLPADFPFYTPAEVAARRGRGLAPRDVNRARPDVPPVPEDQGRAASGPAT